MYFFVYIDNGILVSPVDKHIDDELELLKGKFNISIEATLSDYVGVNIERRDDGTIHMTQPQLIQMLQMTPKEKLHQHFQQQFWTTIKESQDTTLIGLIEG
jgi:hypothetical protein